MVYSKVTAAEKPTICLCSETMTEYANKF